MEGVVLHTYEGLQTGLAAWLGKSREARGGSNSRGLQCACHVYCPRRHEVKQVEGFSFVRSGAKKPDIRRRTAPIPPTCTSSEPDSKGWPYSLV